MVSQPAFEQKPRALASTTLTEAHPPAHPLNRKKRRRLEREQEKNRKKTGTPKPFDVAGALRAIQKDPRLILIGQAVNGLATRQQKLEIALRVLGQALYKKSLISHDELKAFETLLTEGAAPLQQTTDEQPPTEVVAEEEEKNERAINRP